MSDLVSRLLVAIEETEQAAQACGGAPWVDDVPGMVHVDPAAIRDSKWTLGHLGYVAGADNSPTGDAYRRHIVHNDPAAVLRRCAADKATVQSYIEAQRQAERSFAPASSIKGRAAGLEVAVRGLVRGYGISVEEETTDG